MLDRMSAFMCCHTHSCNRSLIADTVGKIECLIGRIVMIGQISRYMLHPHIIDSCCVQNPLCRLESYITTGRLAPDQVVIDMIADYIAAHKHAKGNIFDGFPRTTHQAEEFDRMLSEQGLKVDVMIYMDVPEEELVKRILLRGKESGRADDASEEVIRDRIKVYHEQTAVVADFYAKQGKFADINGLGTMDEVFDRICQVIDSIRK